MRCRPPSARPCEDDGAALLGVARMPGEDVAAVLHQCVAPPGLGLKERHQI